MSTDWKDKYLSTPFLVTTFLAIGGIAWGVYSHYKTLRVTSLNFGILGSPTLIYDHSAASNSFRDLARGVWFDEDVLTWHFWIWNNGDRRITPDMIREKVTIIFPGVANVYEFGMVEQSNRAFDNIRIDSVGLSAPEDSIAVAYLGWDYLDPGSAAVFYVTTSGTPYQPQISGDILGVDTVEMEHLSSFRTSRHFTNVDAVFFAFLAFFLLFGLLALSRRTGHRLALAIAGRWTVTSPVKIRLLYLFFTYLVIPFLMGLALLGLFTLAAEVFEWLWIPDFPPILEEMAPRLNPLFE